MEFMIPRKRVATYKAPRVFVMRCSVSLHIHCADRVNMY